MNNFGSKLAEKIGILVQGGTVNVREIRLDGEMSRQEFRNRKALLNNVRTAWVEGVLEKSLHEQIPIVLGLETRPDAIESPWNLDVINPDQSRQPLQTGTPVIDVFDRLGEGGTLLILGEAGSGKTITLLQLARDLIARAEKEIDHRIPIVLNLSSWAAEKQTIAQWVVEELNSKYQVKRNIGQQWVDKQELLLLLDGLDEIRDFGKRNDCVTALNTFQQDQATEMVVCCRLKDYEKLGDRLKLKSALVLQSLTNEQIQAYLNRLQSDLTVLKTLLVEDITLQELAQSPLLLSIMVLAYQGIEIEYVPVITISSNRKRLLFNDYINRIFQGSRMSAYYPNHQFQDKEQFSRQDATHCLVWMSKQMVQYSQTIFLIEKLQPYWLREKEIIYCRIGNLLIGSMLFSLSIGIVFGLLYGIGVGIYFGFNFILIGSLIIAVLGGLILKIECVESVKWSWLEFKKEFKRAINFGMAIGLVIALAVGIKSSLIAVLIMWLGFGLSIGTSLGLIGGLIVGLAKSEVSLSIYSNQGIRQSAKNAISVGLTSWLIFGFIMGLVFGVNTFLARDNGEFVIGINDILMSALRGGLTIGLIFGLSFGLFFGGLTCIKHFVLRLILYFTKCAPWNYAKFLDWASDKLFLQKVGGGYIFIHRSLMEHFAEMENDQ